MTPPRFIAFEGPDGCGKGTQMKLCAAFLYDDPAKATDVFMTREPTARLRPALASATAEEFVADRRRHLREAIEPALERGAHVLCDRYKHSTLVYQQAAQGLSMESLVAMHEGVRAPDLTIVLDCDPDVALRRRGLRGGGEGDPFETRGADFQRRLHELYRALPDALPGERVVLVDANGTAEEVAARVREVVWSK